MISRILSTLFLAVLSVGAFTSELTWARESDDHVFIAFGIVAAALAVANWFTWETIREGWNSGRMSDKAGAKLPSLAWSGPLYINSILNLWRTDDRRHASSDATNGGADRRI
jgi:hypothetical protein